MPRLVNRYPSYRLHKQSGQAIVTLGGRDVLLGQYDSDESRKKYDAAISEWLNRGKIAAPQDSGTTITIIEMVAGHSDWCTGYYKRASDGRPTTEINAQKCAMRPLLDLYGTEPAVQFGPKKLGAVRQKMIELGWCRNTINQHTGRIKQLFKWATERELVPGHVWYALRAFKGLSKGRSEAEESEPVTEVVEEVVEQTLLHLSPILQAMVKSQLLAGMRPGEVCQMRAMDITMKGDVWLYKPPQHKNLHHGIERVICIGPKAKQIITPYLTGDPQRYIFPSDDTGKDGYGQDSYRRAVQRACERAFPPPARLGRQMTTPTGRKKKERLETRAEWWARLDDKQRAEVEAWQNDHTWAPNQLRHTCATNIRDRFAIDASQVVLGHSKPTTTAIYASNNVKKAAEIMRAVG